MLKKKNKQTKKKNVFEKHRMNITRYEKQNNLGIGCLKFELITCKKPSNFAYDMNEQG